MEDKISPIDLLKQVITLDGKISAAHNRLDRIELGIKEDLNEIKKDLKDVMGWMNKGKGWAAAGLMIAGVIGGAVTALIEIVFKH